MCQVFRTPLPVIFALIGSVAGAAEGPPLVVSVDDAGALVCEGDTPVLYYQRSTQSRDGKWPRAGYVHPLYDLEGNVISEDFPSDHGHHRGVFWAWHQVWLGDKQIGDPWICKDFVWDVQSLKTTASDSEVSILATVQWKSPEHLDDAGNMIPLVLERTKIMVHLAEKTHRTIDFEISLLALQESTRLGGSQDEKGYGGFSPRIRLSDDQQFFAAGGAVEPTKNAIDAGSWINITGEEFGMAMVSHSSNPGKPGKWILRRKRSMQNAVYPGQHPVDLSQETPTVLRYRLIIHRGDLAGRQLQSLSDEFQSVVN